MENGRKQKQKAKPPAKSKQPKAVKPLSNTASYAMYVVGEIDAYIRKKHSMGVVITNDNGVMLGINDNANIKATFTITLI